MHVALKLKLIHDLSLLIGEDELSEEYNTEIALNVLLCYWKERFVECGWMEIHQ